MPTSGDRESLIEPSNSGSGSPQKSKNILDDIAKIIQTPSDEKADGSTLMSRFKNLIDEKRDWYEKEKKRRQSNTAGQKSEMVSNILHHSPSKKALQQLKEKNKSEHGSEQSGQDEEVEGSGSSSIGNKGRALFKLLRSNTVSGASEAADREPSSLVEGSSGPESGTPGKYKYL